MATPALDDVQFPLAFCRGCDRDVLAYVDLDADQREIRRCVECDERLPEWREVGSADLEAAGYSVLEARGCGNGGGCSSGCGMRR